MLVESCQLLIADTQIEVRTLNQVLHLSPDLKPFITDTSFRTPDIKILYSNNNLGFNARSFAFLDGVISKTRFLERKKHFIFIRKKGFFISKKSFSSCRAWQKLNYFEGGGVLIERPWLMLTLWGYLSQNVDVSVLMHGGLVAFGQKRVLFLGDSGSGKTTLCDLSVTMGGECVTDENPMISIKRSLPFCYATPWSSGDSFHNTIKPDNSLALSGPLSAIFFLNHGQENDCTLLSEKSAFYKLLRNIRTFNWLPNTIPPSIDVLTEVSQNVLVYNFSFKPDLSAVEMVTGLL